MRELKTAFVDESGYTGGHLLDREQPFQSLSAICITEEQASELVDKYFPNHQGKELKYIQLKKRSTYWDPLLKVQEELLNKYNGISYVVDKKYMQLLLFLDDCFEPFLFSTGDKCYYKGGNNLALASMLYYCAPAFWGQKEFDELLCYYQRTALNGLESNIKILVDHAKNIVSKKPECFEFLIPLASGNSEIIDSLALPMHNKNDISWPMLLGLISRLEDDMSTDYMIKHDNTENMKNYRKLLDVFIGIEDNYEIFHSVHNTMKFPLKINTLEECDSINSKGVQLADILAGSINEAAKTLCNLKEGNSYNQQIIKLYGNRNLIHQVPRKDLEELKEEYKNADGEKVIEFFSKNQYGRTL